MNTNFVQYDDLTAFRQRRVKRQLRRAAARNGTAEQVKALKVDQVADDAAAEAWARFNSDPKASEVGDGRIMDQILRFFQFILDNWDVIGPIFGMVDDEPV